MLDFEFTPEQHAFIKSLREFTKKELTPNYTHWDRNNEFPAETIKKMSEIGLCGLGISEQYGGEGADCVTIGIAIEEISKGDFNIGSIIVMSCLVGDMIERAATLEAKKQWLPEIASGNKIVGIGVTEPDCGTDAAALKSVAVKKKDVYILNGEKSGGTLVMAADAMIILAKTDPDAGAKGVSAFLVPMDLPGVKRTPYEDMGNKGIVRGSVFLDDVAVPEKYLLGAEGRGFIETMATFDFSKTIIGLMCVGTAQAALDNTFDYTKKRVAFGKPIVRFEGVSFPLVEHYTKIQAGRWLCFHSLWLKDQGKRHSREASMAKLWCPKMAADAIHDCLIFHGHYGYTHDYPIEQQLRDVIGFEMADGTANAQKIILIRELLGKDYLPY
jgi:cyclohexanecarboxyl-CoA dehydrogenase